MKRIVATIAAALLTISGAYAQNISGFSGGGSQVILPASTAIGAGVDFTSQTSALFASASTSLNFAAPFSISINYKGTSFPLALTNFVGMNTATQVNSAWLLNYTGDSDAYYLQFLTGTGTCATNGRTCTRDSWITDGNQHLLTSTFDGTATSLYVDGTLRDQHTGGTFTNGNTFWQVGQSNTPMNLADGWIWNRALSQSEITILGTLAQQGKTPTAGSLLNGVVAHWALNACYPTCTDSSGNGNTLNVETTGPTVTVTVPSAGATLSGASNTLTATCADAVTCTSVQFVVDGANVGPLITSSPWTYASFDTTKMVDSASHSVVAIGTNAGGLQTTSAAVTFTTNNGNSARTYYFSAAGSNTNNCLTTGTSCAVFSTKGLTLREGDSVLYNKGDSFTDCFLLDSTTNVSLGAPGFPIVFDGYGSGANPTLTSNCGSSSSSTAMIGLNAVTGVTIQNFTLRGSTSPHTVFGILVENTHGVYSTGITIQNDDIGGFISDISGTYSSEIIWQGQGTGVVAIDSLKILNNVIHGLSGVASTDDNGIYGYGSSISGGPKSGQLDVQNTVIQGNLVSYIGGNTLSPGGATGNGILCGGVYNCLVQDNVAHDNGNNINTCGGPVAIWAYHAQQPTFQFNEAYNQGPRSTPSGCDQAGFDLDGGVFNAMFQYNYAHGNDGAAIETCADCAGLSSWGPNTVRFNIGEGNNLFNNGANIGELTMSSKCSTGCGYVLNVYGNTMTSLNGQQVFAAANGGKFGSGVVANNIFVQNGVATGNSIFYDDNHESGLGLTWRNNDWTLGPSGTGTPVWVWSGGFINTYSTWAADIGETGGITTSPALSSIGGGGICGSTSGPQPCPGAYKLTTPSTSPVKNAGIDLTQSPYSLSVGTRDYWGVALASPPNIGADQRTTP